MQQGKKKRKAAPSFGRPKETTNGQNSVGQNGGRKRRSQPARRNKVARPIRITDPGRAFLKCAFAPPDFNIDPGKGIPDQYCGKTLSRKDVLTQSISGTAGRDDYYIIAPTPGIAYWYAQTPAGTPPNALTSWTPREFPGAFGSTALFGDIASGSANRASNVDAFRYASLCAGIYPTSNMMQFAGSIQVWKAPLKQTTENVVLNFGTTPPVIFNTTEVVVSGLEASASVPTENYSHSFIDGMYTVSGNNQPDFPFTPIVEGYQKLPAQAAGTGMFGLLGGPFLGMGDTDSIIIKVTTAATASNTFVLKVWACQEYRVSPNSPFYQYAGSSPTYDPVALDIYRRTMQQIPLAVVCSENAKFWEMVNKVMRGIATTMSYAPGPIGMVGSGMTAIQDGIAALMM